MGTFALGIEHDTHEVLQVTYEDTSAKEQAQHTRATAVEVADKGNQQHEHAATRATL